MPRGRPRKDDALVRSAEMIGWALGGLEREIASTRQRLDALLAQATKLRQRLRGAASKGAAPAGDESGEGHVTANKRARRKMSAEARKRISENMRKRWAERKKKGLKRL